MSNVDVVGFHSARQQVSGSFARLQRMGERAAERAQNARARAQPEVHIISLLHCMPESLFSFLRKINSS